jgi:hypothetical protein
MNYNINDFSVGSGSVSKVLEPGTHKCRIIDIKVDSPSYDTANETLQVTFILEGEPEGGSFVGVAVDKTDPSKGNYEGKIAYVKNGQYAFKDWTTKQGEFIPKEKQLFNFISGLALNLGILDTVKLDPVFAKENVSFNEFFSVVQKHACDPDLWAYFTIGGKEKWTEGYNNPNYNMFFVKYANRKSYANVSEDKVVPFNPEEHIIKTERGTPVTVASEIPDVIPTTPDPFN